MRLRRFAKASLPPFDVNPGTSHSRAASIPKPGAAEFGNCISLGLFESTQPKRPLAVADTEHIVAQQELFGFRLLQ